MADQSHVILNIVVSDYHSREYQLRVLNLTLLRHQRGTDHIFLEILFMNILCTLNCLWNGS